MKIDKVRELSKAEMERKLDELQDQLFKLKSKIKTKQVENTAQLSGIRKDIARIKTVLRAMPTQGAVAPAAAAKTK